MGLSFEPTNDAAVLELEAPPDRGARQLARLADRHETESQAVRDRRSEGEAPCLDPRDDVDPSAPMTRRDILDYAKRIKASDGIIIVTPEYNGGYPASLKNAVDLLYDEWKHMPIGIATVSAGPFGGSQAMLAIQSVLWKMKAWTIPAMFSVPNVEKAYDANGNALDKAASDLLAKDFIKELLWCIEADKAPKHSFGL